MIDYYTLKTLAAEWSTLLCDAKIAAAWTQTPGEVSIALEAPDGEEHTLRMHCDSALPLLFRAGGAGRRRRNTVDVFESVVGRSIKRVFCAERDRYVFFELDDARTLQVRLFGPRPNVFLVEEGDIRDAFLQSGEEPGDAAPKPRAAPDPQTAQELLERWNPQRKTIRQALASAIPLLPRILVADLVRRAGIDPDASPADIDVETVWRAVHGIRRALDNPVAHILWRGEWVEALAPAALEHPDGDFRVERFDSFDRAAGVYARRRLAQRDIQALRQPIERELVRASKRRRRSAAALREELERPSRADGYERNAHLLMAQAAGEGPGRDEIILPNIIDGSEEPVTIALESRLSAVENAGRLYEKARRARRSRQEAEVRWTEVQAEAERAAALLERLQSIDQLDALQDFITSEREALEQLSSSSRQKEASEPFHRVPLTGNVEAWVGKNARGNAELISTYAGPHDYWLHARGVPGSHVVIRRPTKTWEAPTATLRAAAQLAAWHSRARTQPLAPVIVTERKYVRPIKGGPPGSVHVDREEVLMVEPSRSVSP